MAYTVEQALELVKKSIEEGESYSMGFFDVLLGPGKDGIELVKEVFSLDPDIYAVFVTAYHDRSVDAIRTFLGENSLERWGLSKQTGQRWRDLTKSSKLQYLVEFKTRKKSKR